MSAAVELYEFLRMEPPKPRDAGSAGTAGSGYRVAPSPRPPADPTPTPQPAGGASNEKGRAL